MAKRYHQSVKDRLAESRGEERREMHSEMLEAAKSHDYYSGANKRREMEAKDGAMMPLYPKGFAGMPGEVIMREWPKGGGYLPTAYNDDISGIDNQQRGDHSQTMKHFRPSKD